MTPQTKLLLAHIELLTNIVFALSALMMNLKATEDVSLLPEKYRILSKMTEATKKRHVSVILKDQAELLAMLMTGSEN